MLKLMFINKACIYTYNIFKYFYTTNCRITPHQPHLWLSTDAFAFVVPNNTQLW